MERVEISNENVIKYSNEYKVYDFLKRAIDIVGSLCGIILLSPVWIVTILLIKLESKGPVSKAK